VTSTGLARTLLRRASWTGLALVCAAGGFIGVSALQGGNPAPVGARLAIPGSVQAGSTTLPSPELIDGIIARLQRSAKANPDGWGALADLGGAYVQKARITADASYYPKAEQALDRSLRVHPEENVNALVGLGALAAGRHDFTGALAYAERALIVNPLSSSALGVKADALTELGHYDEARSTVQRMNDVKPGVASFSRASYQAELRGDRTLAREALERVLVAASSPSDAGFGHYYLGELAWNGGDLATARKQYALGRDIDPANVAVLEGLARVEAASGDSESAVRDYAEVVARLPLPLYVANYADLLTSLGRTTQATAQLALLDAEATLLRANGVNTDLETSLIDADHGRTAQALTSAQAELVRRPSSVQVQDALAWALHVNGRDAEALPHAQQAAGLGLRSALFAYHRGVIEQSLGMVAAARRSLSLALSTNPHFSPVHAPDAAARLTALGRG
jgi:tetratricopeptide (TPR) repeat protein